MQMLGRTFQKQFKKVIVSGGPLKGARYTEVGWEDLCKAARSYRSDPRFNQYAKRMMAEKAFGSNNESGKAPAQNVRTWRATFLRIASWMLCRARGKLLFVMFFTSLLLLIISRPLFYIVLARSVSVGIKFVLRRSVGFLVIVVDSILSEAAYALEAQLISPPPQVVIPTGGEMQLQRTTSIILMRYNRSIPLWSCFCMVFSFS